MIAVGVTWLSYGIDKNVIVSFQSDRNALPRILALTQAKDEKVLDISCTAVERSWILKVFLKSSWIST